MKNLSLSLSLMLESNSPVWQARNSDNPNNQNPNQNNNSQEDNNAPKCSKCHLNEATHSGLVFTIKDTNEKKTFYDGLLCTPCTEDLSKCQECKSNQAQHISTKNNQEIILCPECYKKEKIIKELEIKVDRFLPKPINNSRGCRIVHDALEKT